MSTQRTDVAAKLRLAAAVAAAVGIISTGGPGPAVGVAAPLPDASPLPLADCTAAWSEPQLTMPSAAVTAVTGVGRSVWAAGFSKRARDVRRPLVLRRTPAGWTAVRIPVVDRETGLFDVAQARDGRVWAVGYESSDLVYGPYVLRGGPGRMARVAAPAAGSAGASLTAVGAAPGGVVAVGFSVGARGEVPLVADHTRGRWSVTRLRAGPSGALMAVQHAGDTTWAAGWQVTASGVRPLVVRRGGSGWRRVDGPVGDGAFLDLAADAEGDVLWGVGYRMAEGRQVPAAWRQDEAGWGGLPPIPTAHALAFLTGVDITADGIVVAGTAWDASGARWVGIAARWDGQGWRLAPPSVPEDEVVFHDLAADSDGQGPIVAGQLGRRSLIQTWCGTGPGAAEPAPVAEPTPAAEPAGAVRRTMAAGRLGRSVRRARTTPGAEASVRVVARDVTRQVGLSESTQTHGGLVEDLDGNGWPDVFISRHGGPAKLMLNERGRFAAPAGAPFPPGDRHSCTAADADADGQLDIYCALGADRGAGFKVNELWLGQGDGSYIDGSVSAGAADPFGRGRVAAFFDLDHDDWPDLFVGNKSPRTDGLPGPSVVFARPGGGSYQSRSTAGFDASMGAVCLHPGDIDGDGWEDLIVCGRNLNRSGSYGIAWLRNEQGTLRDRTAWLGLTRRITMDLLPVDVDRDGRLDLVEVTPGRLLIHLRRGAGYVAGGEAPLTAGRAVAAGDVDGDGDPDLYVIQGMAGANPPDQVLVTGRGGRSLRARRVPGTTLGGADAVVAIDHDRNGLSDFLVLNGAHGAGPIKLIAFFPR